MEIALGTSQLASFKRMAKPREIGRFLEEISNFGKIYVDTAPLYSSSDCEKLIGRYLPEKYHSNVLISSKYGFAYSSAHFPINRILQRVNKATNRGELRRIYNATPKQEIVKTLRRLNRSSLDTYFFHEMPPKDRFLYELDEMLKLQEAGIIRQIGLSTNGLIDQVHEKIEVLQIPFSNLSHYEEFSNLKIEIHSIIRPLLDINQELSEVLSRISRSSNVSKIIVGTSNISHFMEMWKVAKNEF